MGVHPQHFAGAEKHDAKRLFTKPERHYNECSLGFDESIFRYEAERRSRLRANLNLEPTTTVLLTATRLSPFKQLERMVEAVRGAKASGRHIQYIIVGDQGDAYGKSFREKYAEEGVIRVEPFTNAKALVDWYHVADLAYWSNAAISIFEAMGTGLPVMLPHKKNVAHILDDDNGCYHNSDNLFTALEEAMDRFSSNNQREQRAQKAREQFGYLNLAEKLLTKGLKDEV